MAVIIKDIECNKCPLYLKDYNFCVVNKIPPNCLLKEELIIDTDKLIHYTLKKISEYYNGSNN